MRLLKLMMIEHDLLLGHVLKNGRFLIHAYSDEESKGSKLVFSEFFCVRSISLDFDNTSCNFN